MRLSGAVTARAIIGAALMMLPDSGSFSEAH
jgi:hypothetical protein